MMLKNFDWEAQIKGFLAKVAVTLIAVIVTAVGFVLVIAGN